MSYKLGSLFDGSGGFPLSGTLCDIEPMWAAEVEPYPIAVTRSRFPNMKHLGDISKVNGADIEPVDIITFGSPCQDLSVAGKRAGLKHEDNGDDETTRSGLFMEAVRIIKEMRKATNGDYPKFCIWENVPGAFSSNNGQDFRIVLEELIKITEPNAVMPEVPKNGWAYADSYCGDGWSLAYRVFDAQYWGVPQRRRRIYLVTDFRGQCAREILFKREGLRGYFAEGRTQRKAVTTNVERSIGADDREGTVCYGISSYDSNSMKSSNPHSGIYEAETSRTLDANGGNPTCNQGGVAVVENVPYTLKIRSGCEGGGKGALIQEDMSATLATNNDQYLFQPIGIDGYNADLTGDKAATLGVNCGMSTGRNGVITDTNILDDQGGSVINIRKDGKAPTLRAQMGGHPPVVMIPESAEGLDAYNQNLTGDKAKTLNSAASDADHVPCAVYSVENHPADSRVNLDENGKVQTLTSRMGTGGGNVPMVMEEIPKVINLNKDDVQSKAILDPSGIAPSLYAGECRGGGGECYVMEPFCKSRRAKSADDATTWKHADVANTLNTFDQGEARANELVVQNFIDVEMEVAVRKYEVNKDLLQECLRDHKGNFTNKEIAEALGKPLTLVEHWFRRDNSFAIPDADIWFKLKKLLGIKTSEFDQSITEFEFKSGNYDMRNRIHIGDTSPTLTCGSGNNLHLLPTDNAVEQSGEPNEVAYSFDPGASRDVGVLFIEECNKTLTNGTCPGHHDGVVISKPCHTITTGSFTQVEEEKSPTLMARDYKDPTCVEIFDAKERRYIVRRLTPTECARLQGFPDNHGHIEPKTELTDEEYRFWLNVRKTHDAINDRTVKEYNEKQMLTYYNKLWTDSAEYKMWGNGIALPCALYVMQGIKDALDEERTARSKWLDELLGDL